MPPNFGKNLMARDFVITADGGSRGNPGPAAYGATVSENGVLLAELYDTLGIASNNVAEYSGLIAGLKKAHELDPEATIHVKMDSKLVVEQMSGRWQVKHPAMRELAKEARSIHKMELISFQWIPREENSHADRLANKALDGAVPSTSKPLLNKLTERLVADEVPTTIWFVRHGETTLTPTRRFSGIGPMNPPLTETGIAQAKAVAKEIAARKPDVLIASPIQRTTQTAQEVSAASGLEINFDDIWVECDFGYWEGLTPTEVKEQHPEDWNNWLSSLTHRPGDGESYAEVYSRIEAGINDLVEQYPHKKICVVTHNIVIRAIASYAMQASLESMYHVDILPCSITTVAVWPSDGLRALKSLSERAVAK
jgi:ribonuclease H / adenosylcobalamin/alpha-ribazole phosphatase